VYRWEGVSYLRYRDKMDQRGMDARDEKDGWMQRKSVDARDEMDGWVRRKSVGARDEMDGWMQRKSVDACDKKGVDARDEKVWKHTRTSMDAPNGKHACMRRGADARRINERVLC
jgi:hypothetical protein